MAEIVDAARSVYGTCEAALLATLFTGGFRVSEVVRRLRPENLAFFDSKNFLRFEEVALSKKYKKVQGSGWLCHETGPHKGRTGWDPDHKHFKTERRVGQEAVRTCSAPLYEPLIPAIREWWQSVEPKTSMFDFSRFRAYRVIEKVDSKIWPHWFRSQRASQLGEYRKNGGYEWGKDEIKQWFKWSSDSVAEIYAKDNPEKMERMFPERLVIP